MLAIAADRRGDRRRRQGARSRRGRAPPEGEVEGRHGAFPSHQTHEPGTAAARRRRLSCAPRSAADFPAWARLREQSRAFLTPWEPIWPDDDLTRAAFRRRLRRQAEEMARDESYAFLIFDATSDELLGGLTLGGIRRGVAQAATLGYWMGAPHAGKGHMTRAVAAVVALRLRDAAPASHRGGLHSRQRAVDGAAGAQRLPSRRAGARLSEDQRRMARSCPVRAVRGRGDAP